MIVLAIFSWLAVVCAVPVGWYQVDVARVDLVGWTACPSPEDPEALCPIYTPLVPQRIRDVPHPAGATGETRIETPTPDCVPSPGSVCYWIVTAVNVFGRKDEAEVCQ